VPVVQATYINQPLLAQQQDPGQVAQVVRQVVRMVAAELLVVLALSYSPTIP
jgi:hypothetical protein